MHELVTVDCFDTVLTRAVGEDRGLGYVLHEHLRRSGSPAAGVGAEVFVRARVDAERLARRRHGERRTLAHTCAELAALLGLPAAAAPVLQEAEEAVELALARPVPALVQRVRAARAAGAQVGFLSDTALSSAALAAMLRRVGALEDGDLLWVSNELGAEKGEGRAYHAVARELGGAPRRWRHTGDNPRSDVLMARLSGVRATLETAARLTPNERVLDAAAPASGGLSALLAGASRQARLAAGEGASPARTAVVAGVLAPVLAGLVLEALVVAARQGAGRVVVAGPGSAALEAVAGPLARALAPRLAVGAGGDGLVLHAGVVAPGAPGLAPGLALGVRGAGSGRAAGYLVDEASGTGEAGRRALLADVAAALAAAGDEDAGGEDAGGEDVGVLRSFAEELATTLPALAPAAAGGAGVRGALLASVELLWQRPDTAQAHTWAPALAAVPGGWPGGAAARAGRLGRLAARPAAVAAAARPKLARARQLANDRWATSRRPR